MSERGSFVTEFIYCKKCLAAAQDVLIQEGDRMRSLQLFDTLLQVPIIAGKLRGMYPGQEIHEFEFNVIPELSKQICHPMRIAVLAEEGEMIFHVHPDEDAFNS